MVTYNAKSAVFMQQAPFTSFFVVKSGSVKTVHVNERGDERILGFYFPGELFGLDGLTNGTYGCTALALERSMICRLNMDRLEELGQSFRKFSIIGSRGAPAAGKSCLIIDVYHPDS